MAEHLRAVGQPSVWVDSGNLVTTAGAQRLGQQFKLMHTLTSLCGELCTGLAGRIYQSEGVADREVDTVVVRLANPVEEHGMVRGILDEVAKRLGIPSSEVSSTIEVDRDSEPGVVSVLFKNEAET